MGLLSSDDKEKIKRALPKAANKIIDVTVARLYIAYPNPQEWQYTGLSGAIAIVDDIVGHTFFLKLVDISGHRGVLWDQELYANFEYNQDRTFFHTFELEDCYAGLLFENIEEAAHFLKRVQKREKYGSKKTLSNKNAIALTKKVQEEQESHTIHGPRGESLISDQRQRYRYDDAEAIPSGRKKAPPPPPPVDTSSTFDSSAASAKEDDHSGSDFTSDYTSASNTPAPQEHHTKHALPPLPAQFSHQTSNPPIPSAPAPPAPPTLPAQGAPLLTSQPSAPQTPQNHSVASPYSSSTAVQNPSAPQTPNNPFPMPIPQTQNNSFPMPIPQTHNNSFPMPIPQSTHSQPITPPFPQQTRPSPSFPGNNQRPVPGVPPRNNGPPVPPSRRGPAPPPPPRRSTTHQVGLQPQPAVPSRIPSSSGNRPVPPPPPRRGPVPPPPPRSSRGAQSNSYPSTAPQPYAPQQQSQQHSNTIPVIQPGIPPPPALSTQPQASVPAPPPPPPTMFAQQNSAPAPPPPPMPPQATSAAPPPPPPAFLSQAHSNVPGTGQGGAQSGLVESTGDTGRDALLASIRGAGGIGALRKTDKSQLEKPSVLLQEARGETPTTTSNSASTAGAPGGAPSSLADALAAALNQRKSKVGHTEDDYDNGDDW